MKTFIDVPTGIVTIVPQSTSDRMLLFHLLNCSDITHFSEYLQMKDNKTEMTTDLGAEYDQFTGYMEACETGQPLKLGRDSREIALETRLIGFNRDSSLRDSFGKV